MRTAQKEGKKKRRTRGCGQWRRVRNKIDTETETQTETEYV